MKATIILASLALALAFVGCKPKPQAKSQEPAKASQEQAKNGQMPEHLREPIKPYREALPTIEQVKKPELTPLSTFDAIVKAFASNPVKAKRDYIGKPFVVRGKVVDIHNEKNIAIITLTTSGGYEAGKNVYLFGFTNDADVIPLDKGKEVVIEGMFREVETIKREQGIYFSTYPTFTLYPSTIK